jgi:hypothetical protein
VELGHWQTLWHQEGGERLVGARLEKTFLVKNFETGAYLVDVQGETIGVSLFIVRQLNIGQLSLVSFGFRLLTMGGGVGVLLRTGVIVDLRTLDGASWTRKLLDMSL